MLKRGVTIGEVFGMCVVIFGAFLTFWITTSIRLSALEISKAVQESNYVETKASFKDIGLKLDKIGESQNDIKVTLQNKEDRK